MLLRLNGDKIFPKKILNSDFLAVMHEINPHLPSGPVHPYQLYESISNLGVSGVLFHFYSISNRYSC